MAFFRSALCWLGGAMLLASCSSFPFFAPSPSVNIVIDHRAPLAPPRDLTATNSTLGFEAIIALSSEDPRDHNAWRKKGLLRAARRTGLAIEVPPQRDFTYKEVVARRDNDPDFPLQDGEALCYVAHMDALQHVVDRGLGSALILEDDADWDVALRRQIEPVARGVRLLTDASRRHGPYGADWDMLFLGHCGDTVDETDPEAVLIDDPTLLPTRFMRSVYAEDPYYALGERTRTVQYSRAPVCTFGYAVTARGARKVLDYIRGPGREIDLKFRDGCDNGQITCVSVVPELIHHRRKVGSAALSTVIQRIDEDPDSVGREFTHNIRHSARCNWNRWGRNLRYCLPTLEEWYRYIT